ncbi:MAG: hypothetical protein ACI9ON_000472 [Limisphaerales bacterium]|jgi:hypothetical protein
MLLVSLIRLRHALVYSEDVLIAGNSMIPKSIDEVTTAWLGDALDSELAPFTVDQIGQGVGIMGDIYRVHLSQESDPLVPASVVVKLPSSFEENRAQGVALGMFEAEVKFYKELAPSMPVGLPKIHLAEINTGTAEFVIVMEDLCDLELVDQTVGMTAEQASAAVKVLAEIHSVWWNKAQAEEMVWIESMVGPRIEFVDQALVQMLPVFVEGFAARLPPGGVALYELFAGNYRVINRVLAQRSPWTLVHQDFRVENMLFGPAGSDEVKVIDWQGIGRGPGAYDLAYLLGGSMDVALRRDLEQTLVKTYFDALLASGVADYSFEQLWDDYGHAQLMGGLATSLMVGGGMDLSNERGFELIATMAHRHAQAALDHNGIARLEKVLVEAST